MPTRGEFTTGRNISSSVSCLLAHSSQSQPVFSHMHSVHTCVAGLPHTPHMIAGGSFLAKSRMGFPGLPSRYDIAFSLKVVVVPKS